MAKLKRDGEAVVARRKEIAVLNPVVRARLSSPSEAEVTPMTPPPAEVEMAVAKQVWMEEVIRTEVSDKATTMARYEEQAVKKRVEAAEAAVASDAVWTNQGASVAAVVWLARAEGEAIARAEGEAVARAEGEQLLAAVQVAREEAFAASAAAAAAQLELEEERAKQDGFVATARTEAEAEAQRVAQEAADKAIQAAQAEASAAAAAARLELEEELDEMVATA
eukprot:467461-Prymnesium_polylepis.1